MIRWQRYEPDAQNALVPVINFMWTGLCTDAALLQTFLARAFSLTQQAMGEFISPLSLGIGPPRLVSGMYCMQRNSFPQIQQ